MQNFAWVAVLQQIPAEQHNQYMLVTSGGTAITIQALLRIEQEFVAFKGRLAGSQEAGRVFFIPYDNIDYLGTQEPLKEAEFHNVFGSMVVPASSPASAESAISPSNTGTRPDSGQRPVIRSEVLDRYRSRPASSVMLPDPRENGQ
jgi:hypothetical protein